MTDDSFRALGTMFDPEGQDSWEHMGESNDPEWQLIKQDIPEAQQVQPTPDKTCPWQSGVPCHPRCRLWSARYQNCAFNRIAEALNAMVSA